MILTEENKIQLLVPAEDTVIVLPAAVCLLQQHTPTIIQPFEGKLGFEFVWFMVKIYFANKYGDMKMWEVFTLSGVTGHGWLSYLRCRNLA